MPVITAKLVAVFIVCGSGATPSAPTDFQRVCIANVFPAVAASRDDCIDAIQAEATQGELNLLKGGFLRTTNQVQCFEPGDGGYSDRELTRYMADDMGAVRSKVNHYTYDGEGFKVVEPKPRIPGQRM
jgi:hypothetical protein